MRKCVMAMAGMLVAAGVAAADKPTGLPVDPHVEGREPTPIAREFHEADAPPVRGGSGSIEWQNRPGDEQVRGLLLFLSSVVGRVEAWRKPDADPHP